MTENNRLNIVLVEPEIPQNTGNISRTCAAIGASLHLIEPLGFKITDASLKRAGLDYWKYLDLKIYKNLDEFFASNSGNFYFYTTKGKKDHTTPRFSGNVYLFFGKETAGLPVPLLAANADRCLRIPMMFDIRSLNLSNSVAIAAYEVLRQWEFKNFQMMGELDRYVSELNKSNHDE